MNPRLVFALFLAALLASSAFGAPRDFSKVQCQATPLAGGLQMLRWTGVSFAVGNMVVSVGSDGALLVDTGFPELVDKLKAAVAALGPQPIRLVLNTHPHFDHVDGNEWLAGAGALIIAHERSRARMLEEQRLPEFSAKVVIPPYPKAALPVVTCRELLTLHFNGDEIRAIHVPNAHSDGDLLVQFVKANVLHTGDLFIPDAIPFIAFSGGGSLDGMIRGADRILELCDENTQVVPGHGRVCHRDDVRAYRELLITVRDRLTQAIIAGKTVDEVVAANPLADLYQGRQPYFKAEALTRYGYLDVKRAAAANSAPTTRSTDEAAVREADAAWAKAVAAKSADQTLAFYDPEAVTSGPAMFPAYGLPAFREHWAKLFARPDFALTWQADKVIVTKSATFAYSAGTWNMAESNSSGPYLAVWRKQPDGQWKVLVDAAWRCAVESQKATPQTAAPPPVAAMTDAARPPITGSADTIGSIRSN